MSERTGNPKRIETIVINDDLEAPSLLDPTTGRILITNRVGKRIIELADGSKGLEEIVDQVTREFIGAQKPDVLRHAEEFLAESAKKGLVKWTE